VANPLTYQVYLLKRPVFFFGRYCHNEEVQTGVAERMAGFFFSAGQEPEIRPNSEVDYVFFADYKRDAFSKN